MSELTAIKFDLSLIYGLTEEGLIESNLRAASKDGQTLYTEGYYSEQIMEGSFRVVDEWSPPLKALFQAQMIEGAKFFAQVASKQVPLFFTAVTNPPPKFWLKLVFKGECELSDRDSLGTGHAALVLLSPLGNLVWNLGGQEIVVHQTKAMSFDKLDELDWSPTLAAWMGLPVDFAVRIFETFGVIEN
jgi:hypothetical protein